MKRFLVLAALLAAACPTVVAESRPNIVILYADDMGYGDLGVQNPASKIPTPHLDALAREGTRFTDAHSSSGVCTPSRYALLEGRYHWRKFHGIVAPFGQPVLDSERTILPEMLKARGYKTACIGKWHLGWDWDAVRKTPAPPAAADSSGKAKKRPGPFAPDAYDWSKPIPGGPLSHGFDYYFGDDVPNYPPFVWFEKDRVITEPTVPLQTVGQPAEGVWETGSGPSVKDWDFWAVMPALTAKAVEWIGRQKKDEPFFLYFPFTSPHAPIVPAKDFAGKSQAGGFGDFMVQTDDTVGRVLEALTKGGFAENTLVIFSSDNGPEHYAYPRVQNYGHRSMGPLRGLKRDIWEGGHRVPFIVRWPGKVPPGKVSDGLISQIDIFATIATVVGVAIPPGEAEDSFDQLDFLEGKSASKRDTVVHNTSPDNYALRHSEWLLIAAKTGAVTKVPEWFDTANGYAKNTAGGELYHLRSDIGQKDNQYASNPEKVRELTTLLGQIRSMGQAR